MFLNVSAQTVGMAGSIYILTRAIPTAWAFSGSGDFGLGQQIFKPLQVFVRPLNIPYYRYTFRTTVIHSVLPLNIPYYR